MRGTIKLVIDGSVKREQQFESSAQRNKIIRRWTVNFNLPNRKHYISVLDETDYSWECTEQEQLLQDSNDKWACLVI